MRQLIACMCQIYSYFLIRKIIYQYFTIVLQTHLYKVTATKAVFMVMCDAYIENSLCIPNNLFKVFKTFIQVHIFFTEVGSIL